jgi:ferredoxin
MNSEQYDRLTCYYLSGTGNSYRAAQWLAGAAADKGTDAELVPIDDARPKEDLERGPKQLVGIYHPTHGLMPPWSMIKFLLRLPWGRGTHAAIVATRGGLPIGRLVIPGGAGLALFFPLLVLTLKGYRVRGGKGIDMPINLLSVHPGFTPGYADRAITWGQRRHRPLAEAILAGRRYWHPLNLLWELVWCLPFVLWPIFPVAYLLIGRVFMAKLMFAGTSCVGCGRCARNCPNHAIRMVDPKPKTPFWTHHCEVCMRCMGYCKFMAVQASHLWLVPVVYGTTFVTAALVQRLFVLAIGFEHEFVANTDELIALLLTWIGLILAYYLFFGLMRIRALRTMFTYTTFTRLYRRRYHAPGTKSRELTRRSKP